MNPATLTRPLPAAPPSLAERYRAVRARTAALCAPLEVEDFVVSSMEDVSPTKWHLAHTSWFFETFLLAPHLRRLRAAQPALRIPLQLVLRAGRRAALPGPARARHASHARAGVGLSRATWTTRCSPCANSMAGEPGHPAWPVLELGLHHEQQHQELLLTDIKHVLLDQPHAPGVPQLAARGAGAGRAGVGRRSTRGCTRSGMRATGSHFDNEGPAHKRVRAWRASSRTDWSPTPSSRPSSPTAATASRRSG